MSDLLSPEMHAVTGKLILKCPAMSEQKPSIYHTWVSVVVLVSMRRTHLIIRKVLFWTYMYPTRCWEICRNVRIIEVQLVLTGVNICESLFNVYLK